MPLYYYTRKRTFIIKRIIKIISVILILAGIGILTWTIYPILSFELVYGRKFHDFIRPAPEDLINRAIIAKLPSVLGAETADFTKASVWFPQAADTTIPSNSSNVNSYTLDIPKVGIYQALVLVGGDDLSKSLIHFTGPMPGSPGNPVIFGHSTLLWFYNPRDYKSIFSKLPELDENDDIFINLDNITYHYKVIDMRIVTPETVSVLAQNYSESTITLVTCVPPGTYFKRLIVRGKLVNL